MERSLQSALERSPRATVAARPSIATWVVFPLLLAALIAATLALLGRGLPPPLVSLVLLFGSVVLMLMVERLAPLHRAWNRFPDRLDLALVVGNRLVDVAVIAATTALLAALHRKGLSPALFHVWPVHWPLLAQAALGIALAEVVRYTMHRVSHRDGLLGRIHHVHHQPRRMYSLNGPRLHPGNQLWITIANVVPMLLLGARLPAVVLAAGITTFFVVFQHANVNLRFDGLNQLLATPDVHRLHHLREDRQATPVNFGIVLLVLDRLFGTYAPASITPAADEIGPLGDPAPAAPRPIPA
jgi:sterol desaturase/sphingolipid hydroxylase (fatty acid hydroxylase superfamily)